MKMFYTRYESTKVKQYKKIELILNSTLALTSTLLTFRL